MDTTSARMRPAGAPDEPAVRRVCLLTGLAGADASDRHADPELLGMVWAAPYLHAPGAVALVVEDEEGVAGYCVAAADTAAFERWLEADWLPPLRRAHPQGSGDTPDDAALVRRLHAWPRAEPALVVAYPAHLHVDLLPRLQGRRWGRRLVEAVLTELGSRGVAGLHLVVDPANTAATGFYERLGFERLAADGGGVTYGRRPLG
ncbi:GNAT family N-acetyltransferase [Phycicoccus sp. HDW14]|uniref:GNAT family N-acetyltransferase n=1 Tax=Phycicoccus sp. HDW14 TaxID=2714941 RepID=UPI001F0EC35C|nr:GNAT family N-acetyltransferase [Phycicoccus sp. HDW14]